MLHVHDIYFRNKKTNCFVWGTNINDNNDITMLVNIRKHIPKLVSGCIANFMSEIKSTGGHHVIICCSRTRRA